MNTKMNPANPMGRKSISLLLTLITATVATIAKADDSTTAPPPTDPQIAMIAVVLADTVDINAGKLAVKKTDNEEVKAFAQTMIRDHGAVNDQAIALAKKLGVTPEASDTSKSLEANSKAELAKLKELKGSEFDKAYVDNEVGYHEAVDWRARQDPDSQHAERRVEEPAGKRPANLCRPSGACQNAAGFIE